MLSWRRRRSCFLDLAAVRHSVEHAGSAASGWFFRSLCQENTCLVAARVCGGSTHRAHAGCSREAAAAAGREAEGPSRPGRRSPSPSTPRTVGSTQTYFPLPLRILSQFRFHYKIQGIYPRNPNSLPNSWPAGLSGDINNVYDPTHSSASIVFVDYKYER